MRRFDSDPRLPPLLSRPWQGGFFRMAFQGCSETRRVRAPVTERACLTAAAMSLLEPPSNVRVSTPLRNSAFGWAGVSARAARSDASVPACRKMGTGCCAAGLAVPTCSVLPYSSHFAPLPISPGRAERERLPRLGADFGAGGGSGFREDSSTFDAAGLPDESSRAGTAAAVGAGFSRTAVQPAAKRTGKPITKRRILLGISGIISSQPCSNQHRACPVSPCLPALSWPHCSLRAATF